MPNMDKLRESVTRLENEKQNISVREDDLLDAIDYLLNLATAVIEAGKGWPNKLENRTHQHVGICPICERIAEANAMNDACQLFVARQFASGEWVKKDRIVKTWEKIGERCPTCGMKIKIYQGDEGTGCMLPDMTGWVKCPTEDSLYRILFENWDSHNPSKMAELIIAEMKGKQ